MNDSPALKGEIQDSKKVKPSLGGEYARRRFFNFRLKTNIMGDEMKNFWINCFAESLKELEHESAVEKSSSWTAFLTKVMHSTGTKYRLAYRWKD